MSSRTLRSTFKRTMKTVAHASTREIKIRENSSFVLSLTLRIWMISRLRWGGKNQSAKVCEATLWARFQISTGGGELQAGILLFVTMGLNDHEFAPGLPVVRLLTSPREARLGDVRVSGARVSVGGHRFFEGVEDGLAIEPDSPEILRSKVHPGSSQRVVPLDVPHLPGGVIRAQIHAQHDQLSGEACHPVLIRDRIAVEDEPTEPRRFEYLPFSVG